MIQKTKELDDVFAHHNHAHEAQRDDGRAGTPQHGATASAAPGAHLDAEQSKTLFGHFAEAAPRAAAATAKAAPSLADVRSGHAALRQGQKGPAVTAIQRRLHITADGDFGPGTAAAVRQFQQSHHLTSDGIVGAATLHALESGSSTGGGGGGQTTGHGELSGASWVARFPTSSSLDSLTGSFQQHTRSFVGALRSAGANVSIAATRRPPERAFLMHYAWLIAQGQIAPESVPAHAGININWVHSTRTASVQAAQQMVAGYQIVHQPALTSKHIAGLAIDMNISWSGTLHIHNASGQTVNVGGPHSGDNATLHAVGRSYGVIKLLTDPPHWSDDGH